jgi:hypothetical protein
MDGLYLGTAGRQSCERVNDLKSTGISCTKEGDNHEQAYMDLTDLNFPGDLH